METKLFERWPTSGDTVALNYPVQFKLTYNGELITATITHIKNNYAWYLYHVNFSNGKQAQFGYDTERKQWIEINKGATELATSVGTELQHVSGVMDGCSCAVLWPTFEVEPYNIWLIGDENGDYGVAYKGKPAFFLEKTESGWERDKSFDGGRFNDPNVEIFVKHYLEQQSLLQA